MRARQPRAAVWAVREARRSGYNMPTKIRHGGNDKHSKKGTRVLRATFDASVLIEALTDREPAADLLERARRGEFDLAVPEIVFRRLRPETLRVAVERAGFVKRIAEPTAELGRAVLGWMQLGGYPPPGIHGRESYGSGGWRRTDDDSYVVGAHESHARDRVVTRDGRLARRAAERGIDVMTPEELLAALDNDNPGR